MNGKNIFPITLTLVKKRFVLPEDLSLLIETGFTFAAVETHLCEYLFENKRALMDYLKTFSVVDSLPQDKIENFLTDFVNSYAQQFTRSDGQIPFSHNEFFIKAHK